MHGLDENAALPTEPQLADSLTEALKSLKEGSGLLQEPIPPEGLSGMFSGLNLDDVSLPLLLNGFVHFQPNPVAIEIFQLCLIDGCFCL